jgi:hypothetical protein
VHLLLTKPIVCITFSLIPAAMVLLAVFLFASFALTMFRVLFRRGSRGNVPSAKRVKKAVEALDKKSLLTIDRLVEKLSPNLSRQRFSMLCVATAMAVERPLESLEGVLMLREFLDSLSSTEYVILLEELYAIEIPDEAVEKFITFKDVLNYVDSRVAVA